MLSRKALGSTLHVRVIMTAGQDDAATVHYDAKPPAPVQNQAGAWQQ